MNGKAWGLTIIEVLVAIAVLGLAMAAFMTSLMGGIREIGRAGGRTEATQILNYLGRRLVEGDPAVLPASGNRSWDYGQLPGAFPDLAREASVHQYRAGVEDRGVPDWAQGLALRAYRLRVCWRTQGQESCVVALTMGPEPGQGGSAPPLPGIN
ncbi:MAG: prepilin-type cleavage/methylation domain-containing protein [Thermus sp.]